jgi:RNA-binding protein
MTAPVHPAMKAPQISSRARAHLRALAHDLEPVVRIGTEGLTDAICDAVDAALRDHELIKVKIGPSFEGDRKETARALAERTTSDLTQVIGRVVVLYRRRAEDRPGKPRIALPQ